MKESMNNRFDWFMSAIQLTYRQITRILIDGLPENPIVRESSLRNERSPVPNKPRGTSLRIGHSSRAISRDKVDHLLVSSPIISLKT